MVFVYFAEGFEEIEAITSVDILRRAGLDVRMISMKEDLEVVGAHGITVKCDMSFNDSRTKDVEMMILPGGMPGTLNLAASSGLLDRISAQCESGKWVAAICAAPMVLAKAGILEGRRATIYPGMESELTGAVHAEGDVVVCGNIITSRGPGTAMEFALVCAGKLCGSAKEKELRGKLVYHG